MKKLYINILFLIGLLFNPGATASGTGLPEKIQMFNDFFTENYQELVYIHTDKSSYITGERINFKVYCLEKNTAKLSQLSQVAYFEVLDVNNQPQLQAKIELKNGMGYGEVFIPTNINSGNFVLRGYTRWMRNFGPDAFFHTTITIINPFKRLGLHPLPAKDDITIKFFPESGSLINQLKTKVAFECKDKNGEPAEFTGRLFANDTVLVTEFEPIKNGFGSFDFTPDIYNKYSVELLHADSIKTTHKFPMIVGKGLSFQVKKKNSAYSIEVFCNDQTIVQPTDRLYYIVHQQGQIIAKNSLKLLRGETLEQIELSNLKEGIVLFSLFTSEGEFLRQRQLMNYNGNSVKNLSIAQSDFVRREKVSLDLSDIIGESKTSNMELSVSVSAYNKLLDGQRPSLANYLVLGNSLNRYIYGLRDIFNGTDEQISKYINDLLIVYAKTDTIWQAKEKVKIDYIAEYRAPLITGKVKNKVTQEPVFGKYVYISIPGKKVRFNATKSRKEGDIIFEMENFYGSNELIVQMDYTKDTIYSIEIDNPFSQEYLEIEMPVFNIDESMEHWIKQQSENMQIGNAYRQYQPKILRKSIVDSSAFYNEPDSRYYLDDYTRFVVMEEVMREYVYGVNVRKNKEGFHFMALDLDRNEIFSENPLMLLDGVAVFDADEIIAIDPLKIEKIETVKRRFHKGYLECSGIVSYTSYNGDLAGYQLNKHAIVLEYDGVQSSPQYYFPSYPTAKEKKETTPDYRNVIFWDPDISIDGNNSSGIEFYTSDDKNDYEVTINGISQDGKAYSRRAFIKVR